MAKRMIGYTIMGSNSAHTRGQGKAASDVAGVIYQLESMAAEVGDGLVLLMARGFEGCKVVRDLGEHGMRTCAPVTADRKLDALARLADEQVALGEKVVPGLLANAHAVLMAVRSCSARAVLLCGESTQLAHDDEFVARVAAEGALVFCRLDEHSCNLGWRLCETNVQLGDEEWMKCPKCGLFHNRASVVRRGFVCPQCLNYVRMSAEDRLCSVLDRGSFTEWDARLPIQDPLQFPDYSSKVSALRERTGLDDAVRTGCGTIAGQRLAIAVMDTTFLMGSMGSLVGEKLSRMFDRATQEKLPVVVFCASGGARMQEGLISLMQMAKVSCAVDRHSAAGLVFVSVLTDPTTGGVTASFAMQGDIILSEPRALIGFAGQRVIRDTIKQELPEGFQTAEFALEHGLIDAIVTRDDMREVLAHLLALHGAPRADIVIETLGSVPFAASNAATVPVLGHQKVCDNQGSFKAARNRVVISPDALSSSKKRKGGPLRAFLSVFKHDEGASASSSRRVRRALEKRAFGGSEYCEGCAVDSECGGVAAEKIVDAKVSASAAWESVQLARNTKRPTAIAYIEGMTQGFIELHGDRAFGDDAAIVAGIAWMGGRPVTVIAQEKGENLNERIRRNFGCPQPEGYRKALRLMRQAEKFGRPIVCLVDTQGAFCGTQAEERGQGNAIADNLLAMAGLRVPVVSVLLGEGGSGGALALAVSNRVAMQEHAVYSVLSPEGFASILWKDRTRAAEAAAVMRMDAAEVHRMGVVDAVLPEGDGPAHENPDQAVSEVRNYVLQSLQELASLSVDELIIQRHERFGQF